MELRSTFVMKTYMYSTNIIQWHWNGLALKTIVRLLFICKILQFVMKKISGR